MTPDADLGPETVYTLTDGDGVLRVFTTGPDTDDAPLMTAWRQDPSLYAGVGACLSNMNRLEHETCGSWRARLAPQGSQPALRPSVRGRLSRPGTDSALSPR